MKNTRTDPHRPGAILPTDYTWVLSYEMPGRGAFGEVTRGFAVDCLRDRATYAKGILITPGVHAGDSCCLARLRDLGVAWAFEENGPGGKCDVCGAYFRSGDVWLHAPTGQHVHLGHTCVAKYSLALPDRAAWLRWHTSQARLRSMAAKDKRFKVAALRFNESHPGLAEDLRQEHPILKDMAARLNQYGSLSEKQIAFAHKLAEEVRNPKPKVEEQHVPAPEGRVKITGRVVSLKTVDSDYGGETTKMVVKVETPEGSWLCWSTLPAALPGDVKGKTITFTATLTRSDRDAHFAFAKRPSNASIL